MSTFTQGFEFDRMARRPMYAACPRWLVERCKITERSTVVDLGCGSGILTSMLLERFPSAPGFRAIAVDPSAWELEIAQSRIHDPRVTFLQGRAQEAVELVDGDVDAVLLCNVLHQIPLAERAGVLEGALALVRPGGWVGANTLFYDGAVEPETSLFYTRWLVAARRQLANASVRWEPPHRRTPVALQRLSAREHHDLFQRLGYEDIHVEELQFDWQPEDWEALCHYSVFIQGALSPDMPLETGRRALVDALHSTYRALGLSSVRRGWLHVAARRPAHDAS